MDLTVSNRQPVQRVAVGSSQRASRVRIKTAAQQQHRASHRWLSRLLSEMVERRREHPTRALDERTPYTPRTSAPHTYLCAWSWSRTASRSARIHSARVFGAKTPCTGENRTAAE